MIRKKKAIFLLAAILILCVIFIQPIIKRAGQSRVGYTGENKKIKFDPQIVKVLSEQDSDMSKAGYIVENKLVDSHLESGLKDLLPYNGNNMKSIRIVSKYMLSEVISHEKTLYQRFIKRCEELFGRLPEFLYRLDMTKYEGNITKKQVVCEIVNVFILMEDKQDRIPGFDYCAYAGTNKRTDETTLTDTYTENGTEKQTVTCSKVSYEAPHFEGDLTWIKHMAYSNYVSPYNIGEAFETYEIN